MGTDIDEAGLAAEAEFLHKRLFGRGPSERVRARYVDAHRHLDVGGRSTRHVDVAAVVAQELDAEAVELYVRFLDPQNVLTQKLRILGYLLEIEPEFYDLHVRETGTFLSSLPGLTYSVLRSSVKLAKGAALGHLKHVV